jgi:hypothetical protein
MKTVDIECIEGIARDLSMACTNYIVEICKDRLGGIVRDAFMAQLAVRGMSDVAEIKCQSDLFCEHVGDDVRLVTKVGDAVMDVSRMVSLMYKGDIDEMRVNPQASFIDPLIEAVRGYVDSLPNNVGAVSIPAFWASSEAYMLRWCLWGYCAIPKV